MIWPYVLVGLLGLIIGFVVGALAADKKVKEDHWQAVAKKVGSQLAAGEVVTITAVIEKETTAGPIYQNWRMN